MSISLRDYTCGGTIRTVSSARFEKTEVSVENCSSLFHRQSRGHKVAPQLIRHFNLDQFN
jgi:hypothetical protein